MYYPMHYSHRWLLISSNIVKRSRQVLMQRLLTQRMEHIQYKTIVLLQVMSDLKKESDMGSFFFGIVWYTKYIVWFRLKVANL